MGWGGFLAGAAGAAADIADKWITDEMQMIREQRMEEARIRQENRANQREDMEYGRKRQDDLETYKQKKDIDLEYRQKAGIGSGSGGGGSEKYQVMTMEDGSQRLVTRMDLQRMHESGQGIGAMSKDADGNEVFTKGYLGSTTRKSGSASQPNTFESARKLRSDLVNEYGIEGPPEDSGDYALWENANSMLRAGAGRPGEPSAGRVTPERKAPEAPQSKGSVEAKQFVFKSLSKTEAAKLEREGYRLQRNPATGEIRAYRP